MEKILFPRRLTVTESSALIVACNRAEALAVDLELDLSGCTIIGPFGVTYVASCVALRRYQGLKTILLPPRDEKVRTFIAEVGLDRFVESGASAMDGMYGLRQLATLDPYYTESVKDVLVDRVPGMTLENSYPIELCLNELMQNVFEWSKSTVGCFVLARYYKKTHSVRLCVVDRGYGIAAVLRGSQVDNLQRQQKDSELIRLAVTQPRLTSRSNRVGGLGLKNIRETVCGYDGRLTVISSNAKLTWRGQNELTIINPAVRLRGTAIEIDFMPHRPFHADTPGDLF